jgi:hypothetical protein
MNSITLSFLYLIFEQKTLSRGGKHKTTLRLECSFDFDSGKKEDQTCFVIVLHRMQLLKGKKLRILPKL